MPDHFYVYPSYLRAKGSRAGGRRVPAALATPDVTIDQIVAAARRLGLSAEPEPGKLYPREAERFEGRVKITKKGDGSKAKVLRRIAEILHAEAAAPPRS